MHEMAQAWAAATYPHAVRRDLEQEPTALHAVRLGGRTLIPLAELERFVAALPVRSSKSRGISIGESNGDSKQDSRAFPRELLPSPKKGANTRSDGSARQTVPQNS
jgi:hypothetical protein